jgi:hypothetical protein
MRIVNKNFEATSAHIKRDNGADGLCPLLKLKRKIAGSAAASCTSPIRIVATSVAKVRNLREDRAPLVRERPACLVHIALAAAWSRARSDEFRPPSIQI